MVKKEKTHSQSWVLCGIVFTTSQSLSVWCQIIYCWSFARIRKGTPQRCCQNSAWLAASGGSSQWIRSKHLEELMSLLFSIMEYRCWFPKMGGTPKCMVYKGTILLKRMIWVYHHFRKPPERFSIMKCRCWFPKMGVPPNGWFIRENSFNMDDLGMPPF